MGYCGVVEVQSLEEALGATCGYRANSICSDCGVSVCATHSVTCNLCREIFCPSCLSFHEAQHPKAASAARNERRPARSA
jgi:hypothetical protein